MSVLASQVISRINAQFSDTSNGKWTEVEKLEAVNAAIDGAWPHIRKINQDTSVTLSGGTYSYSPSATPEVEYGFAHAYLTLSDGSETLLRRIAQTQSGTTFTLRVPPDVASRYAGLSLRLMYTSRTARVTATTDAIELPLDYLHKAAVLWLLVNKVIQEATADVSGYEKRLVKFERDVQTALLQNQRGLIPHSIPIVSESGWAAYDRYGAQIISNP